MAEQRARGWYWVRISTYWMPVLWDQGAWVLHHSDFDEIGPRAIPPSAAPSQPQQIPIGGPTAHPVSPPSLTSDVAPDRGINRGESARDITRAVFSSWLQKRKDFLTSAPSQPQQQDLGEETVLHPEPGLPSNPAVADAVLDGLLPPLDGEWDYKGDDPAWRLLYRWCKKYGDNNDSVSRGAVGKLFLSSGDSGLHTLAEAINRLIAASPLTGPTNEGHGR